MKRIIAIGIIGITLLAAGPKAPAQEYTATPVTVSTEKIRGEDGKLYLAHVVLEKQTLFSIAKAYNVTVDDIYEANPGLEKEGLKALHLIKIPIAEIKDNTQKFITHIVKWFEDLGSIAKKYGVSKEDIMKANGLTGETLGKKQKLRIPVVSDWIEEIAGNDDGEEKEEINNAAEKKVVEIFVTPPQIEEEEKPEEGDFFGNLFGGKKNITAALILPFNAQKSPSDNHLDFYSGVLMAVRDLKSEGINVDLSVYDSAGGTIPVTREKFGACDIVLGPVSLDDLKKTMDICPSSTTVVSPLEPKAAELAGTYRNFVQAPSPSDVQARDLIKWVRRRTERGDHIILMKERGVNPTGQAANIIRNLEESGLEYSTIEFGLLDNADIATRIEKQSNPQTKTRIIIASEKEAFVNDAIRFANLAAHRQNNIEVFCTSKVRSFDTIEVENLHSTRLHVCTSYFIDYEDRNVQRFLMSYRALFNCEPGPFAFQGYDTAYIFFKAVSDYGRKWTNRLTGANVKGLQSNFLLTETEEGGLVNSGVRRVVYDPDFSVKLAN